MSPEESLKSGCPLAEEGVSPENSLRLPCGPFKLWLTSTGRTGPKNCPSQINKTNTLYKGQKHQTWGKQDDGRLPTRLLQTPLQSSSNSEEDESASGC